MRWTVEQLAKKNRRGGQLPMYSAHPLSSIEGIHILVESENPDDVVLVCNRIEWAMRKTAMYRELYGKESDHG